MKRILIALDYDPTAQIVADAGYDLAKTLNAAAILLHVTADVTRYTYLEYSPIMELGGYDIIDKQQREMSAKLEKLAKDFLMQSKTRIGDESIETLVRNGDVVETILATAAEINADIIVIGTKGRRGLEKRFAGSTSKKVLLQSSKPVVVIPATS
jgi:nucleotide-binding universal stress UspA family protein